MGPASPRESVRSPREWARAHGAALAATAAPPYRTWISCWNSYPPEVNRACSVCPGQPLAIRGSDFTAFHGAFAISWEKTGSLAGITIPEDRILHWADDEIRFSVPSDLPGYIAPGDGFQVKLARRLERSLVPVAAGPRGRIPVSCGSAGAVTGPSLNPSERRALGREVSPGRELGPRPPPAETLDSAIVFRFAPMERRARIGDALVFGGSFEAPNALAQRLRSDPAQMGWTIRRDRSLFATGLLDVRSRRTPWLHRVKVQQAGTYRLELRLLHAPRGTTFSPDLSATQVNVPGTLNRKADPKTLEKRKQLPGSLSKAREFCQIFEQGTGFVEGLGVSQRSLPSPAPLPIEL